ncbi:MAG: S-methyl-5-thioribose-1-phosphate isomerase [Bacteroidota bacterium]|nr:S-methyl-5-thioribose-1-phosphate isomerase [Bacteroidota bacterium]
MKVGNQYYQSIWYDKDKPDRIFIIDQRYLPFDFKIAELKSLDDVYKAIREMQVRGAPVIGACAAYGLYLAAFDPANYSNIDEKLFEAANYLKSARPTAVNLEYAVFNSLKKIVKAYTREEKIRVARDFAISYSNAEIEACRKIGEFGLQIIEEISEKKENKPVNILTHCNAGWLACIDYGTALAPVYAAHEKGIPVHVWVDETRPRNQGARLTTWELEQAGVPYTLIVDNAGGHLMQNGLVDLCLVGSDRITNNGDVANKTGTYLKALAAYDNKIPFYVALPSSSIDFSISDGLKQISIEERDENEVHKIEGILQDWVVEIRISPEETKAANYGFDITPSRLVSGLITERGTCNASEEGIKGLYPEKF